MKIIVRAAAFIGIASLFVGCTLISPVKTPVFPPTLSPAPIQNATPFVVTVPPAPEPSATQVPTPISTPIDTQPATGNAPTRVIFTPGTTYSDHIGNITKGSTISFLVAAEKDQLLMVDVGSRNLDVTLGVKGAFDGKVLVDPASKLTTWQGYLPTTQDYEISLSAGGGDSNYDLGITIPSVIRFAPGAITATVQGNVAAQQNVHYMLYALAGQTMSVKVHSAKNDVLLTLYGVDDGQPIVRDVSGATEWSGVLSKSQNYMIVVVSSGNPSAYLVDITIK